MKKGRVKLENLWSIGKKLAMLALIAHLGTEAVYTGNRIKQDLFPDQTKKQFKQVYGVDFYRTGKAEGSRISRLAETLEKEERNGKCVSEIEITSDNYLKKPITDQIVDLLGTPYGGMCWQGFVWSNEKSNPDTDIHEIKHARTFAILKQNPELLKKWSELAKDKNGRSLYDSAAINIASRIKGLSKIIKRDEKTNVDNEKQGFVSNYARTNVYEDIAEFCEQAEETNSIKFTMFLHDPRERNDVMIKKAALAEQHGLLPKGFNEFHRIQYLSNSAWEGYHSVRAHKLEEFIDAAKIFVKNNPDSVYNSTLLRDMGCYLHDGYIGGRSKDSQDKALALHKKVLNCKFKDCSAYPATLMDLRTIYQLKEDTKMTEGYDLAIREYWKRFHKGDVTLARRGVNDILSKFDKDVNSN